MCSDSFQRSRRYAISFICFFLIEFQTFESEMPPLVLKEEAGGEDLDGGNLSSVYGDEVVIVPRKNVSSRLISRVVVEALGNECCIG
jgi:hypothetical protein